MAAGESILCEAARNKNLEQVGDIAFFFIDLQFFFTDKTTYWVWRKCEPGGQEWRDSFDYSLLPWLHWGCIFFLLKKSIVFSCALEIVSALLESPDVAINTRTPEGWTALVAAADKGHHGLVRALLKHQGTDVNIRDNQSKYTILQTDSSCYFVNHIFSEFVESSPPKSI